MECSATWEAIGKACLIPEELEREPVELPGLLGEFSPLAAVICTPVPMFPSGSRWDSALNRSTMDGLIPISQEATILAQRLPKTLATLAKEVALLTTIRTLDMVMILAAVEAAKRIG